MIKTQSKRKIKQRTIRAASKEPLVVAGQSLSKTARIDVYNAYNEEFDSSDFQKWALVWSAENLSADINEKLVIAPKTAFSPTVGAICRLAARGVQLDNDQIQFVTQKLTDTAERIEMPTQKPSERVSPVVHLRRKIDGFMAELDHVIDNWEENASFSLYEELKRIDAAGSFGLAVRRKVEALRDEIDELVNQKTDQLVDGYSHMSKAKQRKYLQFLNSVLADAKTYTIGKSIKRKPRVKKVVGAKKTIVNVKYQPESAEYKLQSAKPESIIGAQAVYVLNTARKEIHAYFAEDDKGLQISRSSITGFSSSSAKKRVFKNTGSVAAQFQQPTTKAKIRKTFEAIKTATQAASGRLNENTLILKVVK